MLKVFITTILEMFASYRLIVAIQNQDVFKHVVKEHKN